MIVNTWIAPSGKHLGVPDNTWAIASVAIGLAVEQRHHLTFDTVCRIAWLARGAYRVKKQIGMMRRGALMGTITLPNYSARTSCVEK